MNEYTKKQNKWLKITKLKVGDRVRCIITLNVDSPTLSNWTPGWVAGEGGMFAGNEGTVAGVDNIAGIAVEHTDRGEIHTLRWANGSDDRTFTGWWYPFWVLAKIEEEE